MYNVKYNGLTKVVRKPSKYADTIVSPLLSTSGSFDLDLVSGKFDEKYNSYDQNISINTLKYLSNLNYNVKCQRVLPWIKKIYKKIYVTSENNNKVVLEFDHPIKGLEYIRISGSMLDYDLFMWKPTDYYRSVPGAILSRETIINSNKLDYQYKEISSAIHKYGFGCKYDLNRLEIFLENHEKSEYDFEVEYGIYEVDIQYAGIRFFCRDYVLAFNNAVVTEADDMNVVMTSGSETIQISNPDPDKYSCVVEKNQILYEGYPIYVDFNYSYPNKNINYKDIDSYDNLKLNDLTRLRKTYSIKLSLDWFRDNPDLALTLDHNAYILVNNGIYNVLIWFAKAEDSDFEGLIINSVGPTAELCKVFSYRSNDPSKPNYSIRFVAKDDIRLCEQYSIEDDKYRVIARITEPYDNEIKELDFKWHRHGSDHRVLLSYQGHGFRVVESTETNIPVVGTFDALKYDYCKSKRDSFRYSRTLGEYISPGDPLFMPDLPVIETFDINPNYWYIEEFVDEDDNDTPEIIKEKNKSVRELQITRLIETLEAIGFIVNYDPDTMIIDLRSYDSLRIVDISQAYFDENGVRRRIFSVTDNINGSYDMMCAIDEEYKVMDLWSKYPTHSPEFRVTFAYNKTAEYSMKIERLGPSDEVLEVENHIVSLDIDSDYYIVNVLDLNSRLLSATVYRYGKIKYGTYRLGRVEPYNPTPNDILSNLINMRLEYEPFEIFIDAGILDYGSQFYVANLLADKFKLCLFNILNKSDFSYSYVIEFENVSWSYPNVIIGTKVYPNYINFLKKCVELNDYAGEVDINGLMDDPDEWDVKNLMSVYFDNYRYVMSHNYIPSRYGAIHPEIALIEARIINHVYNKIDYNTSEQQVAIQFSELMNTIKSISDNSLQSVKLDNIVFDRSNRRCDITVTVVYNLFKSDPIEVKTTLNVNYE